MTSRRIYAIPVLGRYGLTHGMLAWARCRIWCEQNGAAMVAPFWFKLRIGPYLRRERDKRNYFLLFNRGGAIAGIRRRWLLARATIVDADEAWPEVPRYGENRPVLLRFHNALKDNERKSFAQVVGHGAFLRRELLAMTRRRYHPAPATAPFIALHVRMGDFTPVADNGAIAGATNARLPVEWYGNRLDALRAAIGRPIEAVVFSDGEDADLAPLLSRPDVRRVPQQQSVTDLLQMGGGIALIASGSGFSLWGAFLGSTPRISHPGQSIVPIFADATREIESGYDEEVPTSFLDHVRQRLAG